MCRYSVFDNVCVCIFVMRSGSVAPHSRPQEHWQSIMEAESSWLSCQMVTAVGGRLVAINAETRVIRDN